MLSRNKPTILFRVSATTAFILLCTLLPFLPGRYDSLAVPLSVMAQLIGTVGIVMVPIGALWLAAERSPWLAGRRHVLELVALIASSLVWALVSLAALVQSGFALGIIAFSLWGYVVRRAWRRLRRQEGGQASANHLPVYLVIVPILVALFQLPLVRPAVELSRNRAIRNSEPLIAAIEQYRMKHGQYPPSLLVVHKDYSPGMIGIPEYHYAPSGDAYNLVFEQFTYHFGTREFVVYNPSDEHVMTSHALTLLQFTPEQLGPERNRGHYAVHTTSHPHWKYFWFD